MPLNVQFNRPTDWYYFDDNISGVDTPRIQAFNKNFADRVKAKGAPDFTSTHFENTVGQLQRFGKDFSVVVINFPDTVGVLNDSANMGYGPGTHFLDAVINICDKDLKVQNGGFTYNKNGVSLILIMEGEVPKDFKERLVAQMKKHKKDFNYEGSNLLDKLQKLSPNREAIPNIGCLYVSADVKALPGDIKNTTENIFYDVKDKKDINVEYKDLKIKSSVCEPRMIRLEPTDQSQILNDYADQTQVFDDCLEMLPENYIQKLDQLKKDGSISQQTYDYLKAINEDIYLDRKYSYVDAKGKFHYVYNERGCHKQFEKYIGKLNVCAFSLDINGLGDFNQKYGRSAGDQFLSAFVKAWNEVFGTDISRPGADELAGIVPKNLSRNEMKAKLFEFHQKVNNMVIILDDGTKTRIGDLKWDYSKVKGVVIEGANFVAVAHKINKDTKRKVDAEIKRLDKDLIEEKEKTIDSEKKELELRDHAKKVKSSSEHIHGKTTIDIKDYNPNSSTRTIFQIDGGAIINEKVETQLLSSHTPFGINPDLTRVNTPYGDNYSTYNVAVGSGNVLVGDVPPEIVKHYMSNGMTVPDVVFLPADLSNTYVEFLYFYNKFFIKPAKRLTIYGTTEQLERIRQKFDIAIYGGDYRNNIVKKEGYIGDLKEQTVDDVMDLRPVNKGETVSIDGTRITMLDEGQWSVADKFSKFNISTKREQSIERQSIERGKELTPPESGVTVVGSGDGFSPNKVTSSFVVWMGKGQGMWMDPCAFPIGRLTELGINVNSINSIFISHLHEDHDAGVIDLLKYKKKFGQKMDIVTSREIYDSFLKKTSAQTGIPVEMIEKEFNINFVEAKPGTCLKYMGSEIYIENTLHSIPALGLKVIRDGEGIVISGDTLFDPELLEKKKGSISPELYKYVSEYNKRHIAFFNDPRVTRRIHECGVEGIHATKEAVAKYFANSMVYHTGQTGTMGTLPIAEPGTSYVPEQRIPTILNNPSFTRVPANSSAIVPVFPYIYPNSTAIFPTTWIAPGITPANNGYLAVAGRGFPTQTLDPYTVNTYNQARFMPDYLTGNTVPASEMNGAITYPDQRQVIFYNPRVPYSPTTTAKAFETLGLDKELRFNPEQKLQSVETAAQNKVFDSGAVMKVNEQTAFINGPKLNEIANAKRVCDQYYKDGTYIEALKSGQIITLKPESVKNYIKKNKTNIIVSGGIVLIYDVFGNIIKAKSLEEFAKGFGKDGGKDIAELGVFFLTGHGVQYAAGKLGLSILMKSTYSFPIAAGIVGAGVGLVENREQIVDADDDKKTAAIYNVIDSAAQGTIGAVSFVLATEALVALLGVGAAGGPVGVVVVVGGIIVSVVVVTGYNEVKKLYYNGSGWEEANDAADVEKNLRKKGFTLMTVEEKTIDGDARKNLRNITSISKAEGLLLDPNIQKALNERYSGITIESPYLLSQELIMYLINRVKADPTGKNKLKVTITMLKTEKGGVNIERGWDSANPNLTIVFDYKGQHVVDSFTDYSKNMTSIEKIVMSEADEVAMWEKMNGELKVLSDERGQYSQEHSVGYRSETSPLGNTPVVTSGANRNNYRFQDELVTRNYPKDKDVIQSFTTDTLDIESKDFKNRLKDRSMHIQLAMKKMLELGYIKLGDDDLSKVLKHALNGTPDEFERFFSITAQGVVSTVATALGGVLLNPFAKNTFTDEFIEKASHKKVIYAMFVEGVKAFKKANGIAYDGTFGPSDIAILDAQYENVEPDTVSSEELKKYSAPEMNITTKVEVKVPVVKKQAPQKVEHKNKPVQIINTPNGTLKINIRVK